MIKNILIVDYKAQVLAVVAKLLKQHNLKDYTAFSGSAALLKLARQDKIYGLLLTDIDMPEMDGISLVQKAKAIRPAIITVGMSGGMMGENCKESFDYFLAKPFGMDELSAMIKTAFSGAPGGKITRQKGRARGEQF